LIVPGNPSRPQYNLREVPGDYLTFRRGCRWAGQFWEIDAREAAILEADILETNKRNACPAAGKTVLENTETLQLSCELDLVTTIRPGDSAMATGRPCADQWQLKLSRGPTPQSADASLRRVTYFLGMAGTGPLAGESLDRGRLVPTPRAAPGLRRGPERGTPPGPPLPRRETLKDKRVRFKPNLSGD
jgi:hypothetical protein